MWLSVLLGVPVGIAGAVGFGWWCISAPVDGQAPQFGQLHVRSGWLWLTANDRSLGLRFWLLGREPLPLATGSLEMRIVPWWAEPDDQFAPPAGRGKWQVGTLAVGWPWPALARQWNEIELDRGFLPPVETDDDGSTIRRAAERFTAPAPHSRWLVLVGGLAANLGVFALGACVATFLLLTVRARRAG
jgi:hypothetical protein